MGKKNNQPKPFKNSELALLRAALHLYMIDLHDENSPAVKEERRKVVDLFQRISNMLDE